MTFHRRDFIKPADQEKAHRAYRSEYRLRLPGFYIWSRTGKGQVEQSVWLFLKTTYAAENIGYCS